MSHLIEEDESNVELRVIGGDIDVEDDDADYVGLSEHQQARAARTRSGSSTQHERYVKMPDIGLISGTPSFDHPTALDEETWFERQKKSFMKHPFVRNVRRGKVSPRKGAVMLVVVFIMLLVVALCVSVVVMKTELDQHKQNAKDAAQLVMDNALHHTRVAPSLRADTRYLSTDVLEGRGTGTRGELLAVDYIATQMEVAGLERVAEEGRSYFQQVPLQGSTPDFSASPTPDEVCSESNAPFCLTVKKGKKSVSLSFGDDFVANTDLMMNKVATSADEIVFVGYGIEAPQYDWDDFGDVDVSGKMLLAFVNDPLATKDEPELFGGNALTYFGRWTYKYEEARRRGALGIILIHTDEMAGYPFSVLVNGAMGEHATLRNTKQRQERSSSDSELEVAGWVTKNAATRLLDLDGQSVDDLLDACNDRTFQPMTLKLSLSLEMHYTTRTFDGLNVVGRIRGTDNSSDTVIYTAHHDHLGIGPPDKKNDTIYNGALDNASGVSILLAIMRVFAQLPEAPKRDVVFMTYTAEEKGLLGSEYYCDNPLVPLENTMANFNFDESNPYGQTNDIVALGAKRSSVLYQVIKNAVEIENMTIAEYEDVVGTFFRSDQLSFYRKEVPSTMLFSGCDYVDQKKPEAYCKSVVDDYNDNRYHQPSDEYDDSWDMAGMVQMVRLGFRSGFDLAMSDERPTNDVDV
eukprot:TRINITY_DN5981_c0_g1_i1.p1 TRINITY_DN5981_c0_g1~~TRINITY_DN5981_c0_g1_i1.p1  ORF type:complete len:690 (+),score=129.59 TRINITY_DN5981_c0_g1_i1:86-2155(+)